MPSSPKYDHETIRRYVLGGLTAKQIAARLGCSSAVVWSVMRAMGNPKQQTVALLEVDSASRKVD